MANELFSRIILTWDFKKASGARIITFDHSFRQDQLAGSRYNKSVTNIGFAAWEALEVGDLGKQWMVLRNLDTVNFISWGKSVADATELLRIPPGATMLIYNLAVAPAVKANIAACDLEIQAVEGT